LTNPDCSLKQGQEKFNDYLEEKAKEKFSSKELAGYLKKIYDEYSSFCIGDFIKTCDAGGHSLSGVFTGRKGNKVVIGTREILLSDIPGSQRWRFDESICNKKIADNSKKVKDSFEKQKQDFIAETRKNEEADFLKKLGFFKGSNGKYILLDDFVRERILVEQNNFSANLSKKEKDIKEKINKALNPDDYYRKNGFCKYRNEWMSEHKAVAKIVAEKEMAHDEAGKKLLATKRKTLELEIEKRIFSANGYVLHSGNWQSARELLDKLVKFDLSE
jgi:hypothetical protein